MKTILFILSLLSLSAAAQPSTHSNIASSINDDGKTYSIKIDGDKDGRRVHYDRSFNVAGMTNAQKDALRNRILDSLGIAEPPKPPLPPVPLTPGAADPSVPVTFRCETCKGRTKLVISGPDFSSTHEVNTTKEDKPAFPFALTLKPGAYRYTYWQNGVEQMQLPFTVKAGQENVVTVK